MLNISGHITGLEIKCSSNIIEPGLFISPCSPEVLHGHKLSTERGALKSGVSLWLTATEYPESLFFFFFYQSDINSGEILHH